MVSAAIITIGDEILIGQIIDTNSAWISSSLDGSGIRVLSKLSVGDDRREITRAVAEAMSVCDIVIVTGGLGPTKDDITKKTLADYFGCGLTRHQGTYEHLEQMMLRRGIEFNELNQAQALVPECASVMRNDNGTAPGMWFERDGHVLISLPGVPFEMKALMSEEVMPRLRSHFSLGAIVHRQAVVFGIAESALALRIEKWEDALPAYLKLAYLPNLSNIRLRLSAYDADPAQAEAEIKRQFSLLEEIIPGYIIGYGEETLASAVARILTPDGKTVAVAESCTGGALSEAFTSMPGAFAYFKGGVIAYSNRVKSEILGVNASDIEKYGAVSSTVAEQMASGVRKALDADYAVSTTGVAGPDGGTPEKPVGTVWIGVATSNGVFSRKFSLGNERGVNIQRAAAHAVNLLRLTIIGDKDTKLVQGLL